MRGSRLRNFLPLTPDPSPRSTGARGDYQLPLPRIGHLARDVRQAALRLLRHRHIRKERASPPPVANEGIVWLDGEALCVTQAFWKDLGGRVPGWLSLPRDGRGLSRSQVVLPGGRDGLLVRRWCDRPLGWLWCALRRRPLLSPELRTAGLLFSRQIHGLASPRVLAFGQRRPRPWRTESFLLTEIDPPRQVAVENLPSPRYSGERGRG